MKCISTIDMQTRLDVQELLSHFSHFFDHDSATRAAWPSARLLFFSPLVLDDA